MSSPDNQRPTLRDIVFFLLHKITWPEYSLVAFYFAVLAYWVHLNQT